MDAINKIMQTPSPARHEPNHTAQFKPHTHSYIRCNMDITNHARKPVFVVGLYVVALLLHKIIQIQMFDCVSTTEAARR